MGIAGASVDMTPHRAAPATKLIVRAFTGTSLIVVACRQEQTARYYLNRARRRTALSPPTRRGSSTRLTRIPLRDDYVPAVSRAYLSQKLTRPLPTKDGGTLRTIHEGCKYMAAISEEREQRRHWQQVRELIDQEADVAAVSWKLPLAILKDAKLDVSKVPAK